MGNFKVWDENNVNILNSSNFSDSEQRKSGFVSNTPASSSHMNAALRLSTLFVTAFMEAFLPNSTINLQSNVDDLKSELANYFSSKFDEKLSTNGDISDTTATFSEAASRQNIVSDEDVSVILGKIQKWFKDLKSLAFKDKVTTSDFDESAVAPYAEKIPSSANPISVDFMSTLSGIQKNDFEFINSTGSSYTVNAAGNYVGSVETEINGITIKNWKLFGIWLYDKNYIQLVLSGKNMFIRYLYRDSTGILVASDFVTVTTSETLDSVLNEIQSINSSIESIETRLSQLGFKGGYELWADVNIDGSTSRRQVGYIARLGTIEYGVIFSGQYFAYNTGSAGDHFCSEINNISISGSQQQKLFKGPPSQISINWMGYEMGGYDKITSYCTFNLKRENNQLVFEREYYTDTGSLGPTAIEGAAPCHYTYFVYSVDDTSNPDDYAVGQVLSSELITSSRLVKFYKRSSDIIKSMKLLSTTLPMSIILSGNTLGSTEVELRFGESQFTINVGDIIIYEV